MADVEGYYQILRASILANAATTRNFDPEDGTFDGIGPVPKRVYWTLIELAVELNGCEETA